MWTILGVIGLVIGFVLLLKDMQTLKRWEDERND